MQQMICNEQIRRGRTWWKITTTTTTTTTNASATMFRRGVNTKAILGLRIMSTMNSSTTASSFKMYKVHMSTATLSPLLLASQSGDRSYWNGNNDFKWTNIMTAAMTAMFGAALFQMNHSSQQKSNTECCGIAGVVGSSKNHDARYVAFYSSVMLYFFLNFRCSNDLNYYLFAY
jgi:hypothetical protein